MTVPFFFEGATDGTYKPDGSSSVASLRQRVRLQRRWIEAYQSVCADNAAAVRHPIVALVPRLRATRPSEMPHKFKIGQTVYYHLKDRILSTARGTYTVTGLMPALEGQQREYRIELQRRIRAVAFENELRRSLSMAQDDDPRAPYKVYEGDELKGTYATRAEARRRQQQLEGQQAAGSGPVRHCRSSAV